LGIGLKKSGFRAIGLFGLLEKSAYRAFGLFGLLKKSGFRAFGPFGLLKKSGFSGFEKYALNFEEKCLWIDMWFRSQRLSDNEDHRKWQSCCCQNLQSFGGINMLVILFATAETSKEALSTSGSSGPQKSGFRAIGLFGLLKKSGFRAFGLSGFSKKSGLARFFGLPARPIPNPSIEVFRLHDNALSENFFS